MTQRSKDQRIEKVKPSLATKIFSSLQTKPAHQIDGWAKNRAQWGEVDHRTRGATSPLGGQVQQKKEK